MEDGPEERSAKYEGCVIVGQGVTEGRNMTITQPTDVVYLKKTLKIKSYLHFFIVS